MTQDNKPQPTPDQILINLRTEFDYLWEHYARENFNPANLGAYCAALETLILNRLDEAGLSRTT